MNDQNTQAPDSPGRRNIIAASVGLLAGIPATAVCAAPRDPVAVAFARHEYLTKLWCDLAKLPGNGNFDTPEMLRIDQERIDLDNVIALTPPQSIDGARAQMKWLLSELQLELECDLHEACLRNALEFLQSI